MSHEQELLLKALEHWSLIAIVFGVLMWLLAALLKRILPASKSRKENGETWIGPSGEYRTNEHDVSPTVFADWQRYYFPREHIIASICRFVGILSAVGGVFFLIMSSFSRGSN